MLEALEDFGPIEKHDDGRFVYECVSQPDAIFEGLKGCDLSPAPEARWLFATHCMKLG